MAANVNITIKSPHGGKSVMDLNPAQVRWLVDELNASRDDADHFRKWFLEKMQPHADERPRR